MPYDILMPQLGMTMTEGTVVQWLKKPGESVEKGEFLFIVQTDKVDIEVEAPCSGTFSEVLVEVGQVVPVGTPIGRITSADSAEASVPSRQTAAPSQISSVIPRGQTAVSNEPPRVAAVPANLRDRTLATPRAKKIAAESGLDISLVPDYERRGRIVESDVRRFLFEQPSRSKDAIAPAVSSDASSAARSAIAERMVNAFQTIPHFYLTAQADATGLLQLKRRLTDEIEQKVGVRLSITDLLLRALALAVRAHPEVNAFWQRGVIRRDHINVGFAAQVSDRLVVPVVRDADRLSLGEVAKVRSALLLRAQEGKLQLGDVGDASCTLSNLGAQRIDSFQAIINPPESLILAAGRIALRPMVLDGTVVPRQTIYLSVSADHRLLDGAAGARFLEALIKIVESPDGALHP